MRLQFNTRPISIVKNILGVLISCMIFSACSKPDEIISPEQQVVQYLTGTGNRVWRIKELYENGVKFALTTDQLAYTKTYTYFPGNDMYSGRFTDSDTQIGKWELKGTTHLMETATNLPSGPIVLDLIINHIDANNMDVQYEANGKKIRTVYFAY